MADQPGPYDTAKTVGMKPSDRFVPPEMNLEPPAHTSKLTGEERQTLRGTWTRYDGQAGAIAPVVLFAAVESIIAARVRAARAQERQQVIDELHGFLPEWNYPAHVIAAISLELKDRANHTESSHNG